MVQASLLSCLDNGYHEGTDCATLITMYSSRLYLGWNHTLGTRRGQIVAADCAIGSWLLRYSFWCPTEFYEVIYNFASYTVFLQNRAVPSSTPQRKYIKSALAFHPQKLLASNLIRTCSGVLCGSLNAIRRMGATTSRSSLRWKDCRQYQMGGYT